MVSRLARPVRVAPWLLVGIAGLLLAGSLRPAAAQAGGRPDPEDLRKRFFAGLKAEQNRDRIGAVREAANSGLPAAMDWLLTAFERTLKSRDKNHKRFKTLGEQLDEQLPDRAPLTSPTQRDRILDLQKKQQETSKLLREDEALIAVLRRGMGKLHGSLPPESREAAILPLIRRLKAARPGSPQVPWILTLAFFEDTRARDAVLPLLESPDPEARIAALDALGIRKDRTTAEAVGRVLDDAFWQVRATAVEALVKIGGAPAVEALILALAKVEGRLLEDVVKALKALTGQDFHENKVLWQNWWAKNKADYRGPPDTGEERDGKGGDPLAGGRRRGRAGAARGGEQARADWRNREGGTTFYGIATRSKRLVYILDVSGSMLMSLGAKSPTQTGVVRPGKLGERKIDQAIQELERSITALPEDATFNIVFYSSEVDVWRKGQVPASPANKKKAIAWAHAVNAAGATNIFDAIERAFGLAGRGTFDRHYTVAADTFYLLSDGRSNRGRVIPGAEIRREVHRLNRNHKVVIHTIALGSDADIPFMAGLAADTGGQFVHYGPRGRAE